MPDLIPTVLVVLGLLSSLASGLQFTQSQVLNAEVLQSTGEQCPPSEDIERAQNEIYQNVSSIVDRFLAYRYSCNGSPGWKRVEFINMSDTSYNCPPGIMLTTYSKRSCGREDTPAGCSSTTISVGGSEYSRVCGRIIGYQAGRTRGFTHGQYNNNQPLGSYYVDGVSLTHGTGSARQHIWTFAAGFTEGGDSSFRGEQWVTVCPCEQNAYHPAPSFVGNDYFCESGYTGTDFYGLGRTFFPDDPLWDGQNCISTSTCCQFNSPPWFTKNLSNPTTDDIELRVCLEGSGVHEGVAVELIELYIQ